MNDKENNRTYEYWEKTDSSYNGLGLTLQNEDTVHYEIMQLRVTKDKWNLIIQTKDHDAPVSFEIIEWKENQFICRNDSNDFPNLIAYWLEDNKLKAKISNAHTSIAFEFEKSR